MELSLSAGRMMLSSFFCNSHWVSFSSFDRILLGDLNILSNFDTSWQICSPEVLSFLVITNSETHMVSAVEIRFETNVALVKLLRADNECSDKLKMTYLVLSGGGVFFLSCWSFSRRSNFLRLCQFAVCFTAKIGKLLSLIPQFWM